MQNVAYRHHVVLHLWYIWINASYMEYIITNRNAYKQVILVWISYFYRESATTPANEDKKLTNDKWRHRRHLLFLVRIHSRGGRRRASRRYISWNKIKVLKYSSEKTYKPLKVSFKSLLFCNFFIYNHDESLRISVIGWFWYLSVYRYYI